MDQYGDCRLLTRSWARTPTGVLVVPVVLTGMVAVPTRGPWAGTRGVAEIGACTRGQNNSEKTRRKRKEESREEKKFPEICTF